MRLDELTDEQLDQRLRELVPPSPRSRTWERAQRERLMHYITTGRTNAPTDPSLHPAAIEDQLVELVPKRPERSRSWWAMGTAAAAAGVLIVGLFVVQRVADAPASSQQSATTTPPIPSDRYTTIDEVLDDFDRIEQAVVQPDVSRQTRFYATYFDCMATAGFDVPPDVRPSANTPSFAPSFTREVHASLAFERAPQYAIAQRGYAVADLDPTIEERSGGPIANDPLSQWIGTLSPDQQAAYAIADMGGPDAPTIEYSSSDYGAASMPAAGCNYQALQDLHGDVDTWFEATNELNALYGLVIFNALESTTYQSAVDAWSTCLTEHATVLDNPTVLTGSIEQAVADRDCRDQTNLGAVRNDALLTNANEHSDRMQALLGSSDTLARTNVDG